MGRVNVKNSDTHPTPSSGYTLVYAKTNKKLYFKNDAGIETEIGATVSTVTVKIRNETGGQLLKGRSVAVIGYSVGESCPLVGYADKDNPALRPAIAVLQDNLSDNTTVLDSLVVGGLVGVDTSTYSLTDQLVLGNSGAFLRPPPDQDPFTGEVQNIGSVSRVHATLGEVVVSIDGQLPITASQIFAMAGTSGTPSKTNRFVTENDGGFGAGTLNGIITERPGITFVVDGGVIYADVINQQNPTLKLPVVFDGVTYYLDTLTGGGASGAARVALTAGADDNSPQTNFLNLTELAGTVTLNADTSEPVGAFAWIGIVEVLTVATTNTDGVLGWQRFNNATDNGEGDGFNQYMSVRLRREGAKYISGVDPTVIIDTGPSPDSVKVSTTSGAITQLHKQVFDVQDGNTYYIVNHSSEPYKKITNLNEIDEYADGSPIGNNDRVGFNVFACQASDGGTDRLLVNVPLDGYGNDNQAIFDFNNYAVTSMPATKGFRLTTIRLCRLVLKYNTAGGGTWTNVLGSGEFQNERGQPLGIGGGGLGSGGAITDFSDADFSIFNSADPTKTIDFDLSGLTTATNRTLTAPDANGILALVADLDESLKTGGYWNDSNNLKHHLYRENEWTGYPITDTAEHLEPQEVGAAEDSVDTDSFPTDSDSSIVSMVHKFTITETCFIKALQVYAPNWDFETITRITIVNNTTGEIEIIDNPILDPNGFSIVSVGNVIFLSGASIDIIFEIYNSTAANAIDGGWTSNLGTGIPSSQEINIDNLATPTVVEIHHTDLDSDDRSTELDGVTAGSIVRITETGDIARNVEFKVASVDTAAANSTKYTITAGSVINGPKDVRDNKICTIHIDVPIAQPTEYGVDSGFYPGGNPLWATITTELYYDGVLQAGTTDAFGINIRAQRAYISPDWFIVAVSGSGGSTGGGGGASTFVELTDTPSAYSGDGTKVARVNAGATAIEFHAPIHADLGSVTSDQHHTEDHAARHVNGSDDIQLATASQKGLMSAAYVEMLDELEIRTTKFQFFADQLEFPTVSNWAVNDHAGSAADSTNFAILVRLFDDTTTEGVGFTIKIPTGATNIVLTFHARAESAPLGVRTVGLGLYNRGMPDNAAVQVWTAVETLADIDIPTNEFFQYDTESIALADISVTAGEVTQFELVRKAPQAGTDLTGDWALHLLTVEFT